MVSGDLLPATVLKQRLVHVTCCLIPVLVQPFFFRGKRVMRDKSKLRGGMYCPVKMLQSKYAPVTH